MRDTVDEKLYKANVELVDKNKYLEAENKILSGKLEKIEKYVKKVKKSIDRNNVIYGYMNDIEYLIKDSDNNGEY